MPNTLMKAPKKGPLNGERSSSAGSSKLRRARKRVAAASLRKERKFPDLYYRVRPSVSHHLSAPLKEKTQLKMKDLPAASHSWVGKNLRPQRKEVWTLDELLAQGFELKTWNGR